MFVGLRITGIIADNTWWEWKSVGWDAGRTGGHKVVPVKLEHIQRVLQLRGVGKQSISLEACAVNFLRCGGFEHVLYL